MKDPMVAAIVKEIILQKSYLEHEPIDTVYFGGGTPSLLSKAEVLLILETLKKNYNINPFAEVTLEANPDDLSKQKLDDFAAAGINRLSIGIQSFRDDVLTFFNRAHNSKDAVRSIEDARAAGFRNISIDMIYGVPGPPSTRVSPEALAVAHGYGMQDNNAWQAGLDEALEFKPEHISAYSLTIEERTVFGKWRVANKLIPMDEGVVAEQFEMLMDTLTARGYDHYEISNFSLPGFHSRHNSSYWNGSKYLGVGPSAHSYDGPSRQFNVSNNAAYVRKIENGEIPAEREVLTVADKINEYLMIGLRTSAGCDLNYMSNEYGFKLSDRQERYLDELNTLGKVTMEGTVLKLTNKGKLLADKIAGDLFVISDLSSPKTPG